VFSKQLFLVCKFALMILKRSQLIGASSTCNQVVSTKAMENPKTLPKPGSALYFLGNLAGNLSTSEDCLNLNIWTKPGGSSPKAVIHWIYGGAFFAGSNSAGVYDGSVLADENDIIVVSSNYRLGPLGFASGPDMDSNVGFHDQRAAIEWVRDNISSFGGDPKRITIMGQSAGGVAVDMYSYAYPDDPIIAGAIPMSGAAGIMSALAFPASEPKGYYAFSQAMGCGGEEVDTVTRSKCLRAIPVEKILSAAIKPHKYQGKDYFPSLSIMPAADNVTVFPDYHKLQAEGKFAKIPTLVGTTNAELSYSLPNRRKSFKKVDVPEEDSKMTGYFFTDMAVKCPAVEVSFLDLELISLATNI
jgi:carboxylesterase type B